MHPIPAYPRLQRRRRPFLFLGILLVAKVLSIHLNYLSFASEIKPVLWRWLTPAVTIVYCPHSGLTNQLYQLMAAMDMARSLEKLLHTTVTLRVPDLLNERTGAPACGSEAYKSWCNDCPAAHRDVSTSSWDTILDSSALRQSKHKIVFMNESVADVSELSAKRIVRACHLSHWCGLHMFVETTGGHAYCQRVDATGHHNSQSIPLVCVRRLLLKHLSLIKKNVVLQFGSIYGLIPLTMQNSESLSKGFIKYRDDLRYASNAITQILRSRSATGEFWCAHIRIGISTWDIDGAPQFLSQWHDTASTYSGWINTQTIDVGLVLTDNVDLFLRESVGCARGVCLFEADIISQLPILRNLTNQQLMATFQLTCARSESLFLTAGSSYSAYISQLQQYSPMIHEVFRSKIDVHNDLFYLKPN